MRKRYFKQLFSIFLLVTSIVVSTSSCEKANDNTNNGKTGNNNNSSDMISGKVIIKVGTKTFTVTLSDNSPAKAFKEMLPITINMAELNGNEKYFDLAKALPSHPSNPGTIQSGDLMLFGSRTLVLFYKSSSTSYRYTRLGKVDDAAGLASALGPGNVTVTFYLEP